MDVWRPVLIGCSRSHVERDSGLRQQEFAVHYLTYWRRNTMAAILQMTFSNAFSWMKWYQLRLRFCWSLLPRFQLTIFQHWFRWWLGANQVTSHYLNQWWFVYKRIYVSLDLNDLTFNMMLNCSRFLQPFWIIMSGTSNYFPATSKIVTLWTGINVLTGKPLV